MTASLTSTLTTITRRIQALRRATGTVNLLEDMQKEVFLAGPAAAVSGQAGMVANAVSLARYDGENVEHIALLINGQLAVGTYLTKVAKRQTANGIAGAAMTLFVAGLGSHCSRTRIICRYEPEFVTFAGLSV
jgi:hypothetical protein